MAFVVYPASLPPPSSWRETPAERRQAASRASAPQSFRARGRERLLRVSASWVYSAAEMQTWKAWHDTDLLLGQRRFSMPRTPGYGGAASMRSIGRYIEPPRRERVIGGGWRVSVEMEVTRAASLSLESIPGLVIVGSTRRLISGAPHAFRARRADGAEQDIGFNPDGSLDTIALASFGGASLAAAQVVYNQSNPANNLLAFPSAPKVRESGAYLGGFKTEAFVRALISSANSGTPTAFTAFFRGRHDSFDAFQQEAMFAQGADFETYPRILCALRNLSTLTLDCFVEAASSGQRRGKAPPASTTLAVYAMRVQYGTPPVVRAWKDGIEYGTNADSNAGSPSIPAMAAGRYYFGVGPGNVRPLRGLLTDMIVFESLLSEADIEAINELLMT